MFASSRLNRDDGTSLKIFYYSMGGKGSKLQIENLCYDGVKYPNGDWLEVSKNNWLKILFK